MADLQRFRLAPEELRREHNPATFTFECTEELAPLAEFIGQDRALRSLEFGLGLAKPGYNIFVTGLTGTGKATAILEYIKRAVEARKESGKLPTPADWCYVYNFGDPDRPDAISLPAGLGRTLREKLDQLLLAVRTNVTRAFASEEYERQRREILERAQGQAQQLMSEAQQLAEQSGFVLRFLPTGVALLPVTDGKPMVPEEFEALSVEEQRAIAERQRPITQRVNEVGERLRTLERGAAKAISMLDTQVADASITEPFQPITSEFQEREEIAAFLVKLRAFTVENIELFRQHDHEQQQQLLPMPKAPGMGQPDPFVPFRCNVFIENSGVSGPPIIVEPNPSWTNLFGRIERRAFLGTYISDHTMLKPGAVHRANGGYLILNLVDVMSRPGAWDGLKRLIRTREARLEDPLELYGYFTPQTLRPEPIPIDIKLAVTGEPMAYFLLSAYEEEFWEMFKVKADFDYQIPRNEENALSYAGFICACSEREGIRHFDRAGVSKVVEHGSRMVDDQEKLSGRFGRLRDVLIEADYWAGLDGAALVSDRHVQRAIDERIYRLNLVEERIREMITRGTLIVDVGGAAAGQINGLAVLDFGDFSFGRPSRITARTFMGQRGVISIDRESQLSGKIHDKGVMILSGYLGHRFAQDKPLSLSASISFEQGYEAVDGDSASLAELCAIISSLADAPIRQDMAVTGSVNQKGEVQPIGGVNQKVEGFHDLCRVTGFSGEQGVVIPSRNRQNLMLRPDVLESVRDGKFRVYAVSTVDEAVELLTGEPAGERQPDGAYPEGSINARVDARLRKMGETMRRFARPRRNGVQPVEAAEAEEEAQTETDSQADE